MDHFQSPRNRGHLDDPDIVGVAGVPGRGRFLVLYLKLEGGRISVVRFQCHGCGVTIACGSALSELIQGQSLEACQSICEADIVNALDGVPPNRGDCPAFAISALRETLRQTLGAADHETGDDEL
jgi:nitrogen fixation NifU-like protein